MKSKKMPYVRVEIEDLETIVGGAGTGSLSSGVAVGGLAVQSLGEKVISPTLSVPGATRMESTTMCAGNPKPFGATNLSVGKAIRTR